MKKEANAFRKPAHSGQKPRNGKRIPQGDNETRKEILRAATRLFVKQGFNSTTTRQIADYAKVNEALIFYHHINKQHLYWEALDDLKTSMHTIDIIQSALGSGLPNERLFQRLAEDMLRSLEQNDTLLRLLLVPDLHDGATRSRIARFYSEHIAKTYEVLAQYIHTQMQQGIFRRVDPLVASRAFVSLVTYHVIIQEFMGGKYRYTVSCKKLARTVSGIWLEGMKKR